MNVHTTQSTDKRAYEKTQKHKQNKPGANKMSLLEIIMDLGIQGLMVGMLAAALIGSLLNLDKVTFGALLFIGATIGILYKLGIIEVLIEEITQGM